MLSAKSTFAPHVAVSKLYTPHYIQLQKSTLQQHQRHLKRHSPHKKLQLLPPQPPSSVARISVPPFHSLRWQLSFFLLEASSWRSLPSTSGWQRKVYRLGCRFLLPDL